LPPLLSLSVGKDRSSLVSPPRARLYTPSALSSLLTSHPEEL